MFRDIVFEIKKKAIHKHTEYIIREITRFKEKSEMMKDGGNIDFFKGSCETCDALIWIIKKSENGYIAAMEFGDEDNV